MTDVAASNRAAVNQLRIGQAFARHRKALGISQGAVAAKCQLDHSHVSKFERGHHSPSLLTIERFCTALGLRISQLFEDV